MGLGGFFVLGLIVFGVFFPADGADKFNFSQFHYKFSLSLFLTVSNGNLTCFQGKQCPIAILRNIISTGRRLKFFFLTVYYCI